MKKLFVLMMALMFSGCVSWGGFNNQGFSSRTILKGSGYTVEKTVSAKASAMYILGSIMLDDSQADLYKRAFKKIRSDADLEGKSHALANVTTDIVVKNYIVVSFVELTVSADVVKFTK